MMFEQEELLGIPLAAKMRPKKLGEFYGQKGTVKLKSVDSYGII